MPPAAQTMTDWLSAQQRLAAGLTDPSGQTLTAEQHPPWEPAPGTLGSLRGPH